MPNDRLTIAAARPGMRVRWADNDAAPETTIRYVWPDMVQVAGHVCAYHPQNFIPADPVEQPTLAALLAERDAATARAEAAENALFTLRNRAGCGPDQSGPDVWQQRDAAIAERDALRDEWEEIAAGITTEQPEVGALWPLVSEVSGSLAAARNLFRNEVVAHNRTKAERDRMRAALEKAAIAAEIESAGHAIAIIEAALTSAKEA